MGTNPQFTSEEKTFLAGCIKSVIMADGKIDKEELQELQHIQQIFDLDDFSERLNDFENTTKDDEAMWNYAKTITNPKAQDDILTILYELSLQEGYQSQGAAKFISELKDIWGES